VLLVPVLGVLAVLVLMCRTASTPNLAPSHRLHQHPWHQHPLAPAPVSTSEHL